APMAGDGSVVDEVVGNLRDLESADLHAFCHHPHSFRLLCGRKRPGRTESSIMLPASSNGRSGSVRLQGGTSIHQLFSQSCGATGERRLLADVRSEEHTSELQSRENLVCR